MSTTTLNMNFKLLKSLDHWLGLSICAIFGLWARFQRLLFHNRRPSLSEPRRIIILKWFGLGTSIKLSPLLYAIRRKFPDARIIFFTFQDNRRLLELLGCCHEIKTIRTENLIYFFMDTLSHLLGFGFRGGDIAIDLEFFSNFSILFTFLSGAPIRIGYYSSFFWQRSFIDSRVDFKKHNSLNEAYRAVGKIIDIEINNFSFHKMSIPVKKRQDTQEILKEYGWKEIESLLGINVNVSQVSFLRRWPAEHFIYLIESLIKEIDVQRWKIVLIGSTFEKKYTDNIFFALSEQAKNYIINLTGRLDLEQFIALMDFLKFLITGDSGPLYFAATQGTPTISLWGPTSPYFHMGEMIGNNHVACYLGMNCSPCFDYVRSYTQIGELCQGRAPCLKNLKPDIVINHALNFIRNIE